METIRTFRNFILIITIFFVPNVKSDCLFSINADLSDPQPLFLQSDGSFLAPINTNGDIQIKAKAKIIVSCPGGNILPPAIKSNAEGTCVKTKNFQINGQTAAINDIVCSKQPQQILAYTGQSCGKNKKLIQMGFQLTADNFHTQIMVCFDTVRRDAIYAMAVMPAAIGGFQSNYPRPNFKEEGFYHLPNGDKVDTLYNRGTQRININRQLSLEETSTKWIHATNDYYLARGHLAAKTDFVFGAQQRLTFNFVNAAPQWQTANAGNWGRLEDSVRNYASRQGKELTIYTGTHGAMTLPHAETGEATEIYLYDDGELQAITVPEIFWKVVYHAESQAGVAFVIINNPYLPTFKPICKDICAKVTWPTWEPSNQKSGFGYCCEVNDFRKTIKELPAFQVTSILN